MFGMGYCLNTTLMSFSNFFRRLSTFTRARAHDGHWKSPNSTNTVLADRLPFAQPSVVITGLSDVATFEEAVGDAAAGELSEPVRFTKNIATATATTTSAAKAVRGLAKERVAGSEGF